MVFGPASAPECRAFGANCARLCHEAGGELEQIQFLLGYVSVQTTKRYLGCKQRFRNAVNDHIGLDQTERTPRRRELLSNRRKAGGGAMVPRARGTTSYPESMAYELLEGLGPGKRRLHRRYAPQVLVLERHKQTRFSD